MEGFQPALPCLSEDVYHRNRLWRSSCRSINGEIGSKETDSFFWIKKCAMVNSKRVKDGRKACIFNDVMFALPVYEGENTPADVSNKKYLNKFRCRSAFSTVMTPWQNK